MQENNFGLVSSKIDIRDYKLNDKVIDTILPDTFILSVVNVKDQDGKPTCVPHVMSEVIEYYNNKQHNEYTRFSTDYIYGMRDEKLYKGPGVSLRDGFRILLNYGDVPYDYMPGNHNIETCIENIQKSKDDLEKIAYPNRISSYYKIKSVEELKYSLYNHGPVVASMHIHKNYKLKNNVYTANNSEIKSSHAILIIGWDEENWIVQNSWGIYWGNLGLFKIPINDSFKEHFIEVYGVTDTILEGPIKKPNKIITTISPIVNHILNLLRQK